jgi:hypothetical protein
MVHADVVIWKENESTLENILKWVVMVYENFGLNVTLNMWS